MNTLAVRFASQLDDALFEILHGCQIVGLPSAGSGKWSATDNLAHLGRDHEVFAERLEKMLREDAPEFARHRADDDAEFATWRALPVDAMVEKIRALRRELSARVEALTAEQLDRMGVHPAFGRMRLKLWIEFFLVHEAHHLYVILQRTRGV